MKKIIFYIDAMQLGGANRVMANLVDYFSESGSEVILVNDILPVPNQKEYEINPKVRREYLDKSHKVNVNKILKESNRIFCLRRLVKREQPEVVVSFMGPPNLRMLIATMGLKIKKVVSVRNDPNKEYGNRMVKWIAKLLFRFADGCVFQTEDAANYFPKNVRKKSRIIFNPVNQKFYIQPVKQEEKEIIWVGRLQSQKNPELALRAFASVKEKFSDYKLIYYGDGELRNPLQEQAKELNISDSVVFYGQVSDIEEKMATAAIYILTSDYEGMPNALMEAMAVGLPVISTECPCGGPRSLIENEKQGILVSCGSERELANAMEKLLSDEALRKEMRRKARKRAEQFHPQLIFNQWEVYLKNICMKN